MSKITYIVLGILLWVCAMPQAHAQPCFPDQVVTAAYATGGASPYIDKVLWLTWGSTEANQAAFPYGQHDQELNIGDKSRASIHLGGNTYLCVEVEIVNIVGDEVNSYAPGNWQGDSMDVLYNIGGSGKENRLVAGIINRMTSGGNSTLTFRAKATINGEPIRISGLAIADAEALNASGEYIRATAYGTWNIVDMRKNVGAGEYRIAKRNAGTNQQQRIEFQRGTDNYTGAVAFLDFNEFAYDEVDGLAVEFSAQLYGTGKTAIAIGLLTPNADLGDAPESYGAPIHLLQNLNVTPDNIPITTNSYTNINTASYTPGALEPFEGRFLGSTAPDANSTPVHSKDALGDDNSGEAGPDEEDAWPEMYRRFSYKAHYLPGNEIQAEIAYNNGEVGDRVSGWIDFDLNGTFDESERQTAQITAVGNGTVTLTWTVPPTRRVYSTYVRLRYFDVAEDHTSPDSPVNFGEVEDHRMYILGPGVTNPMLLNQRGQ